MPGYTLNTVPVVRTSIGDVIFTDDAMADKFASQAIECGHKAYVERLPVCQSDSVLRALMSMNKETSPTED